MKEMDVEWIAAHVLCQFKFSLLLLNLERKAPCRPVQSSSSLWLTKTPILINLILKNSLHFLEVLVCLSSVFALFTQSTLAPPC